MIANRHMVTLNLNPFSSNPSEYCYAAPLFIWLIISIFMGFVLGLIIGKLLHYKSARKKNRAERLASSLNQHES